MIQPKKNLQTFLHNILHNIHKIYLKSSFNNLIILKIKQD
jgi:hypothetical protein